MSVSVLVGGEHAGSDEAVLIRMLPQELSIDKETINQWQKGNDESGDGRSKDGGEKSERQKLREESHSVFSEPLYNVGVSLLGQMHWGHMKTNAPTLNIIWIMKHVVGENMMVL